MIEKLWHFIRGYEFVPAEVINNETGTLDDNCSCFLCKRKAKLNES